MIKKVSRNVLKQFKTGRNEEREYKKQDTCMRYKKKGKMSLRSILRVLG
jgi:hypothetical protein